MSRRAPLHFVCLLAAVSACNSEDARDAGTLFDATAAADAATLDAAALDAAGADAAAELDGGPAADATSEPDSGLPLDTGAAPDASEPLDTGAAPDAADPGDSGAIDAGSGGPLTLTSPALAAGGVIPRLHTCGGRDLQPQLDFSGIPAGTQSLAIVLIDDTIDFVHWIALDIPAGTLQLPAAASDDGTLPAGTREIPAYGTQYRGPCPPNMHTYSFRLYALSVAQTTHRWPRNIDGADLSAAFDANTLEQARLTGTYTP